MAGFFAVIPTVLGIFLVIHELTLHGVLGGVSQQQGGVNFGSSVALSKGQFPYSDFVLTQPPGMTVLLLPFAWAAHSSPSTALDAARGFTAVVAVVDVFLVGFAARFHGIASTLVAGVLFAVFPYAFYATSTVMLEPYLLLFCILAFLAAFTEGQLATGGRLVLAGVLIGIALAIKSWAIVPAIALLVCAAIEWRHAFLRILGGIVIGFGVPCITFLLASPSAFWRNVVSAELTRGPSTAVSQSFGDRLAEMLGFGAPVGMTNASGIAVGVGVIILVIVVVAAVARGSAASMLDWALLGTTAGLVVIAFVPHALPLPYTYFLAGFGAIVIGNSVGALITLASTVGVGAGDLTSIAAIGLTALFVGGMVAIVSIAVPKETDYWRAYFLANDTNPTIAVQALVPQGACVISNNAEALIIAGRFTTLPAGCPYVVDPNGIATVAGSEAAANAQWEQLLSQARYIVVAPGSPRILVTPQLQAYVSHHFALIRNSNYQIYENNNTAVV